MKKLNWKRFFKSLNILDWIEALIFLGIIIAGIILSIKFLFIGPTVTEKTVNGEATCAGGIFRICSSNSQEVIDTMGN